ncbi:MAG TPA: DUF2254 domain-containing protein [Vicinamibacterales bacterium]|nr:DUF2254 domain-containing protein [Vicinamibacterales bacterium]
MAASTTEERGLFGRVLGNARDRIRRARRYVRNKLTWSRIYRATSYARSALWIVPLLAVLLVMTVGPIIRLIDQALGWRLLDLGVHGAEALYQTVITLTSSFLVFTFGSLLVAIQIAGAQLTPRVIATTLLRDNVVRYSVGLFVFTLMMAVTSLNRLEDHVLEIAAFIIACLGILSLATFLFLIDYAARLLRPGSILARVGDRGVEVIASVYPDLAGNDGDESDTLPTLPAAPRREVLHDGQSQVVLAVDLRALMLMARRARGVIEFVPRVGDFVPTDEPLFVLHGGATSLDDRKLREAVAFGPERTMEQDPLFALRILVDIALKALSAAINDPTTSVLAIDQIQRLLRAVGRRRLHGDVLTDGLGQPRVIHDTPEWDDFVHLACTEIRANGGHNIQVARRLRAMFENLIVSLPRHRHRALEEERARLDSVIASLYPLPADLALARIPDAQGLGGSRTPTR